MSTCLKAKEILSSALNITEIDVSQAMAIGTTPEWDSLAHMRLILALEACIGKQLDMEEVLEISSLEDIKTVLARHLTSR